MWPSYFLRVKFAGSWRKSQPGFLKHACEYPQLWGGLHYVVVLFLYLPDIKLSGSVTNFLEIEQIFWKFHILYRSQVEVLGNLQKSTGISGSLTEFLVF